MGNRQYTDPFCWALRDNDYERAEKVLDEHIAQNKRFNDYDSYYGLKVECRNLDLFWKALQCLYLFDGHDKSKQPTYYDVLKEISTLKGSSRRINSLYKKALQEKELPENFVEEVMLYANQHKKYDVVEKLLKKGANPNYMINHYSVLMDVINSYNKKIFDVIFQYQKSFIFNGSQIENGYEYDPIQDMAANGVLEEFLGDKLDSLSIDERNQYQSYLLLNLMNNDSSAIINQ